MLDIISHKSNLKFTFADTFYVNDAEPFWLSY